MTEFEKNELVKKYEPLVNKMVRQFSEKVHAPWDDIKSMAYEGLAIAINTYDTERSNMTFTQFAGFAIRNNILTSLNNELRTVKLSAYAQKKVVEYGESTFNTVSIDSLNTNDDNTHVGMSNSKYYSAMSVDAKFDDGDVFETLYYELENNFSDRDCKIFYMTFGLKNYDITKGKDIAEHFKVYKGTVSVRVSVMIIFIRKNEDLMEILANLLK